MTEVRRSRRPERAAARPKPEVVLYDLASKLFPNRRNLPKQRRKLQRIISKYLTLAGKETLRLQRKTGNNRVVGPLNKRYAAIVRILKRKYGKLNINALVTDKNTPAQQAAYRRKLERERAKFNAKCDRMNLQQLIAKHPDRKQAREWMRIKDLKWPMPRGKVKLIMIAGGGNLHTGKDVQKMIRAMRVIYRNKLQVIKVPYTFGTNAQVALRKFEGHVKGSSSNDLVIPYFSGHSVSRKRDQKFVFMEHSSRKTDLRYGISSDHLRGVVKRNRNKKFMFMFDGCYSGSALDDPISRERNIIGMIASASKSQTSGGTPQGGRFTTHLTRYMGKGMQLGEAFIRADVAIRYKFRKPAQNPTAFFRSGNRKIEVS